MGNRSFVFRFAFPAGIVAALAGLASWAGEPRFAFDDSMRLPAGRNPGSVALADLDDNEQLDVVAASEEDDHLTV